MSHSFPSIVELAAGCILVTFLAGASYLLFHTLFFPVLLPMLIAYATATWVRRVGSHSKTNAKWASMALATLLCITVLLGSIGLVSILAKEAQELVEWASTHVSSWNALPHWLTDPVPLAWQSRIEVAITALIEKGATWLGSVAGAILTSLPGAALTIVFTIASLFYWLGEETRAWLTTTLEPLHQWLAGQLWWEKCGQLWQTTSHSVAAYLRTQVSLSAVVFVLLSIGLSVLGIHSATAWAALITIADLLPLIGAGVILVPWAIFVLLAGQTALGIGLLVVEGVCWLLRQILEPKLTGHALGVPPYVMLVGVYMGYRIGGIGGMLCATVLLGGIGK